MIHLTRRRNVKSILESGLIPEYKVGFTKWSGDREAQPGVYLFEDEDDARLGGSTQLLRDKDPNEWHLLNVEIPSGCRVIKDPEYSEEHRIEAYIAYCHIPPEYITYLYPVRDEE